MVVTTSRTIDCTSKVSMNSSILPASIFDRSRMSSIERLEVLAGGVNASQVWDRLGMRQVLRLFLQHFAVADDRIQRRAELVAHVRQELALGLFAASAAFFAFRSSSAACFRTVMLWKMATPL